MSEQAEVPHHLHTIADEITSAIQAQRNDEVRTNFSLLMKVAVSQKKMRRVWNETTELFGLPTGTKELRQKRRGPFWVFDRFIDFENGRALLSITLNKRGRVYGLFLVPATVPGEDASPNIT